jgi:hypothetical protein
MIKLSESGSTQKEVSNALVQRIACLTGIHPGSIELTRNNVNQYFFQIKQPDEGYIWLISNVHMVSVGVIKVNRVIMDVYIPERHLLECYR